MPQKLLIKNIHTLAQVRSDNPDRVAGKAMRELPCLNNAWLAVENGLIADFGTMEEWPGISDWSDLEVIDAENGSVLPTWCDSHTHLVYAGSREKEFVDRINGMSYEDIANRGGGILNSAAWLRTTSEDDLYASALARLNEVVSLGTGAIEIKSGYGLSIESELMMLRVIRRLRDATPIPVKATLLAAHAVPVEYKNNKAAYIRLIIDQLIPAVTAEGLADYCDVFCEENYFTPEETIQILEAGAKAGLIPKVHANQLNKSGGVQAGVRVNACSVDHLEYVGNEEIFALQQSATIATILPGAAFFLGLPWAPARQLIDAGLPVAVASDYNPGSCPSGNMNQMISLLCITHKITPAEAINAATLNGAAAMGLSATLGSISHGKAASFIITQEIPSIDYLPYAYGSNLIQQVWINGKLVHQHS
jgi:imidazolonepropionase